MLRLVLAIVGGVVVAFVLVFATELLFHAISPAAGTVPDPSDREAMRTYVSAQPLSAKLAVLAGWTLAAFAGSAVAARFGGRGRWPGWVVAGLFLAATASNFLMFPHPTWMVAAAVALIVAAGWLGARLFARTTREGRAA